MGRHKSDNPRTAFIGIRLLPSEKAEIEEAARVLGTTTSKFIVQSMISLIRGPAKQEHEGV